MRTKGWKDWARSNVTNILRLVIVLLFLGLAVWAITLNRYGLVIANHEPWLWLTVALVSVGPELAGIVIGVVTIDYLNERRQESERKRILISQLGSERRDITELAIIELRNRGWLYDGSLNGANLSRSNLEGAILRRASLIGVDLAEANLEGADLSEANLCNAWMPDINMIGAHLPKATLDSAHMPHASMVRARLENASLKSTFLGMSDLRGATFREADFQGATLSKANLANADLYKATLHEAWLVHTEMERAFLVDADFTKAHFEGVLLRDAKYNARTRWPKMFNAAETGAQLIDWDELE